MGAFSRLRNGAPVARRRGWEGEVEHLEALVHEMYGPVDEEDTSSRAVRPYTTDLAWALFALGNLVTETGGVTNIQIDRFEDQGVLGWRMHLMGELPDEKWWICEESVAVLNPHEQLSALATALCRLMLHEHADGEDCDGARRLRLSR